MSRPTLRRLTSATAIAALALTVLPASTALAQERDIQEFACPAGEVPDPGFSDDDVFAQDAIHCIVWYGIAEGTSSTTYSPRALVGRGAMAKFIANVLDAGGVDLPTNPEDAFPDDDDSPFELFINQLAELGVVGGFEDGEYKPALQVSRAQMASFLARAYEAVTGEPLPEGENAFTDDEGNTHEDNINRVAAAGIAAGTSADTYSPGHAVRRDQMALFIARELDLLVEEGFVAVPRQEGDNPTALDVPELLRVEQASATQLRFVFDEALNSTVASGAFAVYSYAAERTQASAAQRADDDAVVATFPPEALEQATLAGVAANAVQDTQGNTSPEANAPIADVDLEDGNTTAPDLVDIANIRTNAADFVFDEAAHSLKADGYHLVLDDGTVKNSSAVATGSGTTTHTVTFSLTEEEIARIAYGYVDPDTVSDEEGDDNPLNGVEGDSNPLQAVDVSASGLTTRPDLIEAEVLDARRVRYVFDENVARVTNQFQQAQGSFRVYFIDATSIAAESAERESGNNTAFIATFAEGSLTDLVAGAVVAAGTVQGTDNEANTAQELGFPLTFAAGDTAAPELESAAILQRDAGGGSFNRVVRYLFDQNVDTIVNQTRFKVYAQDGSSRAFVAQSGAPVSPSQSGCFIDANNANVVECRANSAEQEALYEFLANAVVATIERNAVTSDGGYANAEAAAILTGSVS